MPLGISGVLFQVQYLGERTVGLKLGRNAPRDQFAYVDCAGLASQNHEAMMGRVFDARNGSPPIELCLLTYPLCRL